MYPTENPHFIYLHRYRLAIAVLLAATAWVITDGCGALSNADTPAPLTSVSTVAGLTGEIGEPFGLAFRGDGLFISDGQNGKVWRTRPGQTTIFAEGLDTPSGLAFDTDGNLLVADSGTHSIISISPDGSMQTLAGTKGQKGDLDGPQSLSQFNAPTGIAVTPSNRIYVADTYNHRIRVIDGETTSTVQPIFTDGPRALDTPTGLAVWGERLIIADTGNRLIRVLEPDGRIWTLAGTGETEARDGMPHLAAFFQPVAVTVTRAGVMYVADGNAIRQIGGGPFPFVQTISNRRRGIRDGSARSARFNRPSGVAAGASGEIYVADSDNRLVRKFSSRADGHEITAEEIDKMRGDPAEFRSAAPARWPYDPPNEPRDVAGTLGEIRGAINTEGNPVWFHNGLDIAGAYGETARFVRSEKVLKPIAVENFGTSRELLRMPSLGYIHIRIGRDGSSIPFNDDRFQFIRNTQGRVEGVRVPRGARFDAGEPVGTLNSMNHVHLIAGRSGFEMNGIDALSFPGLSDTRSPTIENVGLFDENWREIETKTASGRISLNGNTRIVVRAYDQANGNSERRRLGVYRASYSVTRDGMPIVAEDSTGIRFDRLPPNEAVPLVYAAGSVSGATGITVFNYIVSNLVQGGTAREEFLDAARLEPGSYELTVTAEDYFGNRTSRTLIFEVKQ
ncbi:MAG: hypothetical protein ABR530_03645 [Pyrinomonadaceae bacterium]